MAINQRPQTQSQTYSMGGDQVRPPAGAGGRQRPGRQRLRGAVGKAIKTSRPLIGMQEGAINQGVGKQDLLNRPNEVNPFGSLSYNYDPATGRMTQTSALDGSQQALLDQDIGRDTGLGQTASMLQGRVQSDLSQPFDFDPTTGRQRIENQLISRFNEINDPRFQQENMDFDQEMSNRGIPLGSPQYNQLKMEHSRAQNDARTGYQTQALQLGGQEMDRDYGMAVDNRNRSINELASVLANRKGPTLPQFQARSDLNIPTTDVAGIVGNVYNRQWQSRENAKDRRPSGGGGGGGGGGQPVGNPWSALPQDGQNGSSAPWWSSLAEPIIQGGASYVGQQLPSWLGM